jgi:hypothetical protein
METGSNPVFEMYGQIIPLIKKYDEALKQADFTQLNLFLQISMEGLSLSTFNTENNKFLSIEHVEFDNPELNPDIYSLLKHFFSDHFATNHQFKSVYILFESTNSSLIPEPMYDESEKMSFSKFSFTQSDDHDTLSDKIKNLDAYNLYLVPKVLKKDLEELFPGHKFYSHAGIFIDNLLVTYKNSVNQKRIFINVRKSYLDIVILDGRSLLYFNTFNYLSKEDFIYYVIYVMDQLKLNPEEIEIIFSGIIEKNSLIFDTIYKYVRNVSFQPKPAGFSYSYLFSDIPSHYFFNLLHLPLCES